MTKIIDCTVRDGGHLTNWSFSESFVKELYLTALESGVDFFEVGYRNLKVSQNTGDFAVCDDDFLFNLLPVDDKCKISVMVDAGKSDASLFKSCSLQLTPISLVRVATYAEKLPIAFELSEKLMDKGYKVILNLMAFAKYQNKDLEMLFNWKEKKSLQAVCFADSFGSFYPDDVKISYDKLVQIGFKNISFHPHNNLQLAFANSLIALKNDFYSLDASVCGVGRSAGILPVELLLGHMQKNGNLSVNPLPYFEFIKNHKIDFANSNLSAIISGLLNLHPNLVSKMLDESSLKDVWENYEKII